MRKSYNTGRNLLSSPMPATMTLMVLLSVSLFFVQCQKVTEPDPEDTIYLVDYEKINNYNSSFVKLMLGSLSAVYPGIDTLMDAVEYGVDIYKVRYKSTYQGSPIVVSGLVSVPASEGNFPVLSFQNGTNTYKLNAPSVNPSDPFYTLMEMMASHGYVVTMPDYLGFGETSGMLHPYYDKESTARVVIDLIRAAHELLNTNAVKADGNGEHFLMGYSQGGWATLASLKELEAHHSDSIPVKAASCGAGAYDIPAMSEYVLAQNTYPGPLYLPYFIYSKMTAGDLTQPLTDFFKEPYATNIPQMFNGTFTNTEVNDQLTDHIDSLVTDELRLNLATSAQFVTFRELMVKNSVSAWNPSSTIRFYHGTSDHNVPPVQSALMYDALLSAGASTSKVTLIPVPDATHESGLMPWGVSTIMWFDSVK